MSRRSSARALVQGQQDEEALQRLRIPLSLDDITMSSTEEYNRHLVRLAHLSAEQIHLIKDIRRRGKNKVRRADCCASNARAASFRLRHRTVESAKQSPPIPSQRKSTI